MTQNYSDLEAEVSVHYIFNLLREITAV